jgi:vacuolar-type H+-ATPase subunit I/STV1
VSEVKDKTILEIRKEALTVQISDTQKQIKEVLDYITKDGVDNIFSNQINTVMPSLVQLQHRLSQLEVELHTLNSFQYYK